MPVKSSAFETREIDCLCCQEATAISEEKFAGKSDYHHLTLYFTVVIKVAYDCNLMGLILEM